MNLAIFVAGMASHSKESMLSAHTAAEDNVVVCRYQSAMSLDV